MNLLDLEAQVLTILKRAEMEFQQFVRQTDLNCLPGCGTCCIKHKVMASPLEALPLAFQIYRKGEASKWAEINFEADDVCQIFSVHNFEQGLGQCSEYLYRPFICRSFGAMGVVDKMGKQRLSLCHLIKEFRPKEMQQTEKEMNSKSLLAPRPEYFQRELNTLRTGWWIELMPINIAIQEALKAVAQFMAYQEHSNQEKSQII